MIREDGGLKYELVEYALADGTSELRRFFPEYNGYEGAREEDFEAFYGPDDDLSRQPANRFAANLHTIDSLRSVPPLAPLVAGVLDLGTIAVIHGAPKAFKTFLAADIALSVAAGNWWQGRPVTQRTVVYVAAEGQAGFVDRVDAWLAHHHAYTADNIRVVTVPVNLADDVQVGLFADAIAGLDPGFVVFDTLARNVVGVDENSSRDMGKVISHVDWLRDQLGACIALVHHDNRSGTNMRGSSALDGACDTSISVVRDDSYVTAKVDMAKHHADGTTWRFTPKLIGNSVVLDRPQAGSGLSVSERAMLDALGLAGAAGAVSTTVWMAACDGVSERTFYRSKPQLIAANLVAVIKSGRTDYCQLTDMGQAARGAEIQGQNGEHLPYLPTPATPPAHLPPLPTPLGVAAMAVDEAAGEQADTDDPPCARCGTPTPMRDGERQPRCLECFVTGR